MPNDPNLVPEQEDVEQNKVYAVLAYIIFFLPLLAAKNSKFAMYHANQGLILFIAAVIINIAGAVIPVIGWFLILPVGGIALLILAILGIIKAAKGEMAPLPLIGHFTIIKS